MKVIFEDDGNDLLSKLFRYAYKDTSNFIKDCLCKYSEVACRQMSLIEKSVTYISQYDCVPSGSTGSIKTPVNNLYDIHVKLVDEFNSFSSYLKSVDTRKDVKYFNLHKQHNVIWT